MSLIKPDVTKKDMKSLIDLMKKFHEFHKNTGLPDYSTNYVAYLAPLTMVLLKSEERLHKLTLVLILLTVLLIVENIIIFTRLL